MIGFLASLPVNIPLPAVYDWLILLFLSAVNIVGAALMMIDKRCSRLGQWRVRERTFFLLAFLGGGIGEITAMYLIRHKTKHPSFVIGLPVITVLFYGFAVFFLFFR